MTEEPKRIRIVPLVSGKKTARFSHLIAENPVPDADLTPAARAHRKRANAIARRLSPLFAAGDFDAALALLRSVKPGETSAHWLTYHLGKVHGYRGEWELALRHLEEAQRLAPDSPVTNHALGIALFHNGRHNDALNAYAEATHRQRDYVEAWMSTGIAWLKTGDPNAASGAFHIATIHAVRHAFVACGLSVRPLEDDPGGIADDDPMATMIELPTDVARILFEAGRFAVIQFHLGMAQVGAERFDLAKQAFENAIGFGLQGTELGNAEAWLAKYASGRVVRRRN